MTLERRLMAEWLGTFSLLATIVGSGIMAERLADENAAIALLASAIPTGAILVVRFRVFRPIFGAHFNPAVTLCFALRREISARDSGFYVATQVFGRIGQCVAEFVATFGLVGTILAYIKAQPQVVPMAAGLYITAAYLFTSSASFANPVVTIAREFSDTFAGIAPGGAAAFITIQFIAAVLATSYFHWFPKEDADVRI